MLSDCFDEIKFPEQHLPDKGIFQASNRNEKRVFLLDFLTTITHSITENQFVNETLTSFNSNLIKLNILEPIFLILKNPGLHLSLADKSSSFLFDSLVIFI
jgi:hypothetical protein